MEMFYYLKAWFGYYDITLSDVVILSFFVAFIGFGIYTMMKKDVILGFMQIILSLFTPMVTLSFIASNREIWDTPTKMWMRMMDTNLTSDLSGVAFMSLVLVPAFIIVTMKNISLLKR